MVHLILIPVIPTMANPAYWDTQAGWLLAYVPAFLPNKIRLLEDYLRMHSWEPTEGRHIRVFSGGELHTIPSDIMGVLMTGVWHVSIQGYQVGVGPENPSSLFEEYDEERHG